MLILLPPSEGKATPLRGRPLDLPSLSFAEALTGTRTRVLDALTELAAAPAEATRVLGVDPRREDLVAGNARVWTAPSARADRVFTGVLFDAVDLPGLDGAAKGRATRRVAIASAAFGLVRPGDRIADHRLSAGTRLPGVGGVDALWRAVLPAVIADAVGRGLLLDLRSQAYVNLGTPSLPAGRTASIRVLVERDGRRSVVSHANKATKGRIVRDLLTHGADPRSVTTLVATLRDLGWRVETDDAATPGRLDVVVDAV